MDRDRYKKVRHQPALKKRSINGEETHNLRHQPAIIVPSNADSAVETTEAQVQKATYKSITSPTAAKSLPNKSITEPIASQQKNQIAEPDLPALFDEDDEDLFGVWKTQKDIKKARQEKEAQEKAAKLAAKMFKKEQKRVKKQSPSSAKDDNLPTRKSNRKKYFVASAVLIMVPICVFVGSIIVRNNAQNKDSTTNVLGQKAEAAKPDFDILKPTTSDNQATDPKYDKVKKVASYNDVLADVPITVSQQPLPSGFIADPTGQVEKLAKQINANDKISTSDTTAYAGISIKGPQTVVFTKDDLLIFIIANKKIDAVDWTKYIEKMI